jgi:hypothetical protein
MPNTKFKAIPCLKKKLDKDDFGVYKVEHIHLKYKETVEIEIEEKGKKKKRKKKEVKTLN